MSLNRVIKFLNPWKRMLIRSIVFRGSILEVKTNRKVGIREWQSRLIYEVIGDLSLS